MERLTPAEELVMLKLWKLQKGAIKEIQELFEKPKPAYQPRFKMQTSLKKENDPDVPKAEPSPTEEKPAAYKPRFNMKNIKPESEE